jgi:hypothetical protein
MSSVYLINNAASATITLPTPTNDGQYIWVRQYANRSTAIIISFAGGIVPESASNTPATTYTFANSYSGISLMYMTPYWYIMSLQ